MKYTVYYLKREHSRDAYFITASDINPSQYERVACVEAAHLEDLFRRMNCVDGSDIEYVGRGKLEIRSLSVGDVVVCQEGTYLCAGCGWDDVTKGGFES